MKTARDLWGKYPKQVRLVWAPYFKVDAEEVEKWDDSDPICKALEGQMVDGKVFPKSDFAYTPSDNTSEWKLRLTSTPGGKPDPAIVGAAVAALGKGFRGKKVQIPASALAGVKAKVRAAWHKANPDKGGDVL